MTTPTLEERIAQLETNQAAILHELKTAAGQFKSLDYIPGESMEHFQRRVLQALKSYQGHIFRLREIKP